MAETAPAPPALAFGQIPPTYESLGLVVDMLAESSSFDAFEFGSLARTLTAQLRDRHHLCAFVGSSLVGYCGFMPVTSEVAERWRLGQGLLEPCAAATIDAMALTVVAVRQKRALWPMIGFLRKAFPNVQVYFKRSYGHATRPSRKSTVRNCIIVP